MLWGNGAGDAVATGVEFADVLLPLFKGQALARKEGPFRAGLPLEFRRLTLYL